MLAQVELQVADTKAHAQMEVDRNRLGLEAQQQMRTHVARCATVRRPPVHRSKLNMDSHVLTDKGAVLICTVEGGAVSILGESSAVVDSPPYTEKSNDCAPQESGKRAKTSTGPTMSRASSPWPASASPRC